MAQMLCRNGGTKMSKVICDVCGTTYSETAATCPICGSAKTSAAQTAAGSGRTPVKGGRFSKTNVRKRNKRGKEPEYRSSGGNDSQPQGSNAILIAVVILLVIAILAVLCYMGVRVFLSNGAQTPSTPTIATGPSDPSDPSEPTGTPCTSVTVTRDTIEFTKANQAQLISYTIIPSNTTDAVTFVSDNPEVATVTDKGLVTAVSGGQAIITITCGDKSATCTIICNFDGYTEPTDPSEESTVPTPPGYELTLKLKEFTMSSRYPNPVSIYVSNASVKATDITWSSDDPTIATVNEKGVVSAVGRGSTTIRATFGDQSASCKVIVAFDPEPPKEYKYTLNKTDVTIKVGESFNLFLSDGDGVNVRVEWTASAEGYVNIKDNRTITGAKSTADQPGKYITLTTTIDGETYSCVIRVVEPTPAT